MASEISLSCLYDDAHAFWMIYCLKTGQQCDFEEVLEILEDHEKDKITALITWAANTQSFHNIQKSRQLQNDIYEFKQDQFRMLYFYHSKIRRLIIITHMFRKKGNKCPPKEVRRADEKRLIADTLTP